MKDHALVGKGVIFLGTGNRIGRFGGIVRKVTMTRGTKARPSTIKTIVVQRPGGPGSINGKSYSARCGGDRIRLVPDEIIGVSWFGKLRTLDEFLGKVL
tara:strand:+ start:37658 stop:37954 length:297 start_codon:yes stop_codon:yes gene_type:complete